MCEESIAIVVLEGLPEVFCLGADFKGMHEMIVGGHFCEQDPEPLYDLWERIATGGM